MGVRTGKKQIDDDKYRQGFHDGYQIWQREAKRLIKARLEKKKEVKEI